MPHYFAYGSNLDLEQMAARCSSARTLGSATLKDHRLCFPRRSEKWGSGGVAGVEPCYGQTVWGVIYELSEADLDKLDGFEGVEAGHYRRERMGVTMDGRLTDVDVYLAVAEKGRTSFPPSPEYLKTIVRGARHHRLPDDYLEVLLGLSAS